MKILACIQFGCPHLGQPPLYPLSHSVSPSRMHCPLYCHAARQARSNSFSTVSACAPSPASVMLAFRRCRRPRPPLLLAVNFCTCKAADVTSVEPAADQDLTCSCKADVLCHPKAGASGFQALAGRRAAAAPAAVIAGQREVRRVPCLALNPLEEVALAVWRRTCCPGTRVEPAAWGRGGWVYVWAGGGWGAAKGARKWGSWQRRGAAHLPRRPGQATGMLPKGALAAPA